LVLALRSVLLPQRGLPDRLAGTFPVLRWRSALPTSAI
jgi:hypothetical protein